MKRTIIGLAAAGLLLAGCSGGDDKTAPSLLADTPVANQSSAPPAPATSSAPASPWLQVSVGTEVRANCATGNCDVTFTVTNIEPSTCGVTAGKRVVAIGVDAQTAPAFSEISSSLLLDYELWSGIDAADYATRSDSVRACDGSADNLVPLNEGSNQRGTIYLSVPEDSVKMRLKIGYGSGGGGYEWDISST